MLKIRLDKRIRYQGHGDIAPDGPPNYFQKLFTKYTSREANCPDWLRRYFPDNDVREELICLRKDAVFYMIEAAKLEVRTSRGWHHRRHVGELRILGGRLARLKNQAAAGSEIAQVQAEIQIQRSRRPSAKVKVQELLELSQYRRHTVIFTATEYLRSPGRYALIPFNAIRGLCDWLSFPEIGIRCTGDTIKAAGKHFSIDRRDGKPSRVYQYQPARNKKGSTALKHENEGPLNEQVLFNSSFKCHLCGQQWMREEIGRHLTHDEQISSKLIGLSLDPAEFYHTETDETLASCTEAVSAQVG